jgi:F0F1-type ATP synthase epsilon subunit
VTDRFRLVIRTPHDVVLDADVRGARVPTETGLVGLRPRAEPIVLAVEPGLIVVRGPEGQRYCATSGGLFEGDRGRSVLYTPFAVLGDTAEQVVAALDHALTAPDGELALRRQLGDLEQRILQELRDRPRLARSRASHG